MTVCANLECSKCKKFLWFWWSWKQGQGQTYGMQWKVLSLCIQGVNIKAVPKMVTDLRKFVCPIGHNRKNELWPIKSKNENAVTLFYSCLVVFTWGVDRSDMEPLGSVVLNCCCDLDRDQTDLVDVWWVGLHYMYLHSW